MKRLAVAVALLWGMISCGGLPERGGGLKPRLQAEREAPHSLIDQNVLKSDLLTQFPVPDNGIKLRVMGMFPLHERRRAIPLIAPITISRGPEGTVYVTDASGNQVVELSPDLEVIRTIPSRLPPRLDRPSWAAPRSDGTLYVRDLTGVHVFSATGERIGKFKFFVAAHSIALCRDDRIYVNPIFFYPPHGRVYPLIMQFDLSGRLLSSFGQPEGMGAGAVDNRAFLACDQQRLVVAFVYRSEIQIYTLDGRKVKDVAIRYRPVRELELYNAKQRSSPRSPEIVHRITLIGGVSIFRDRIFLLLDWPRIEILEFDLQGRRVNHYYADEIEGFIGPGGNGLVVSVQRDGLAFYVLSQRGTSQGILFLLSPSVGSSPYNLTGDQTSR